MLFVFTNIFTNGKILQNNAFLIKIRFSLSQNNITGFLRLLSISFVFSYRFKGVLKEVNLATKNPTKERHSK